MVSRLRDDIRGLFVRRNEQSAARALIIAIWRWSGFRPRRIVFLLGILWRLWRANSRRMRNQRSMGLVIPSAVAICPTMQCNYNCESCYSRGRPTHDELTTVEIDNLLTEAEELGVAFIVVVGGEPLLREDMLDLMVRHRRLPFLLLTNGSLVTPEIARRIAKSGNIVPAVSIEGLCENTDERRHAGAYDNAVRAFKYFRDAKVHYGFSATTTAVNIDHLGTDVFVDEMVSLGCALGLFIEYIPSGPNPNLDWVPDENRRATFRGRVLDHQRRKPIVFIHFPYDEYGKENRCKGAGLSSLHINSQGDVEPCPFMPVARENIRQGGLLAACQSPFFRAIHEHTNLLQRKEFACALYEHRAELEVLANQCGAHSTERVKDYVETDNSNTGTAALEDMKT